LGKVATFKLRAAIVQMAVNTLVVRVEGPVKAGRKVGPFLKCKWEVLGGAKIILLYAHH